MQAKELIKKKRDGEELSVAELDYLVTGFLRGEIGDYQMAAWLMAVYFQGLSKEETAGLTRLMWKSGVTFPRGKRDDFWIDKHSTGGVGDKPSLILVPLVTAVCERVLGKHRVRIPMVSGRGLGHSGGTLDKLESVAGFSSDLSIPDAMALLEKNDFFMMGQTADIAPADRLIYALRDVTGTVESLPLIVSSILSKKLSENLDGIVFDVKTGSGAFMETEAKARALARTLLDGAKLQGVDAVAVLTRMDEPLGLKVGNHLEVEECADFLQGLPAERGLKEVTLALAASMVAVASRHEVSLESARQLCENELKEPRAFELFKLMFEAQGGQWSSFERHRDELPRLRKALIFKAPERGYVTECLAKPIGILLNALGGGRQSKDSVIDPNVGFEFFKKRGDAVEAGDPIVRVYHRESSDAAWIESVLREAIRVGPSATPASNASWILGTLR